MIRQSEQRGAGGVAATAGREQRGLPVAAATRLPAGARVVPPMLPMLLPVVIAAIVTGGLFAWWFPARPPGGEPPALRWVDVTAESGLGGWAPPVSEDAPTTLGGGVVCFDYDGDGATDLFFVGGGPWPWEEALAKRVSRGSLALFWNDGTGRFTDVTASAGLNVELQGMSAAAGDFDNDGLPDLYITCVGANHLFRNLGRGRFEDVTESAGVGGEENTWSTGAAWLDVDNDGRLDLVVAHYARWPREVELRMAFTVARVGHSYGAPAGFVGAFPSVYRNLGDGRFAPVAGNAGLRDVDPETGFPQAKTLAVLPVDANEDGKLDLLLGYHRGGPALYVNQGDGTFQRWSGSSDRRQEGASAGLASAGSLPLAASSGDQRWAAWQAMAKTASAGVDEEAAVALPARFGAALLDADGDGRLDVFSGEGRMEADTNRFGPTREFASGPAWWWNRGPDWVRVPAGPGETALRSLMARGLATADFDRDGDPDVVVAQHRGGPHLLRNEQRLDPPWLGVRLVSTRGARDGAGARVEVHTPRRVQVQTAGPAMSLLAQSAADLTFGLGEDARVRRIVVLWPSGLRQEVKPAGVNQVVVITEP